VTTGIESHEQKGKKQLLMKHRKLCPLALVAQKTPTSSCRPEFNHMGGH